MVTKTIGIKLRVTPQQTEELKKLFEAFRLGINWSLKEIEARYQVFLKTFAPVSENMLVEAFCPVCHEKKVLDFKNASGDFVCSLCARRMYSEYTVRKEVYGVGSREVESDLKDVVEIDIKTHYAILFSQAYVMWKSYNGWRNKRLKEKAILESELSLPENKSYLDTVARIEIAAQSLQTKNPKLIWKHAIAQVVKSVYNGVGDDERKKIENMRYKIAELRKISRPTHFPELTTCRTVMLSNNFVKWEDGKLFMTLWSKGLQNIDFCGKEYLTQFIQSVDCCGKEYLIRIIKLMEQESKYCNLTLKNNEYFLMFPLEIKTKQHSDLKACDAFVFMTSPKKTAIFRYDGKGTLNSVKWFSTGHLVFMKRNFRDKRNEISSRRSDLEKMRKIRRRRKKIVRRGAMERRFVSTYNHQLTRKMVDYVMEQSDNPKIIIWDVGNGITQNFGYKLNNLKHLWSAVQQQEYLHHKAEQMGIPVVEVKYNACNNLVCSSCQKKQMNGNKVAKVITQLIKEENTFKCECGYEVNMLINQANNIIMSTKK